MTAIDPVTLVVVQNGLQQVASEMDLTFERAAFSPVISEGFDRSDGIYDKDNGDVIAQGELGLPIFVGVMQFTTRAVIDQVRAGGEALRPGDIFIINDPYAGGTHLMDVKMVKPYFYRGRLWAYLSNTGHWPDTGGSVPGGFSSRATEVQQEGLRLPPVKLYREGVMQPDIPYLMDHGRFGPPGLFGGKDGAPNSVIVSRRGGEYTSPHWSKDEDIRLVTGDVITVGTPGGGGYGDPWRRDPALVARDVARGYFTGEDARTDYGVVLTAEDPPAVDARATGELRRRGRG